METHFNLQDQRDLGWEERAKTAANLLARFLKNSRAHYSVADIGCGDRKLRKVLDNLPTSISYSGFDLTPQHVSVKKFDLRTDILESYHTVIALLGVIEYIPNIQIALRRHANNCSYLLLSHVIKANKYIDPYRLKQLEWVNYLTETELRELVESSGFEVVDKNMTPDKKTLVLLCRSDSRE